MLACTQPSARVARWCVQRERQISELIKNRGRDFFAHKYGAAYLRRQMEVCSEEIAKKKVVPRATPRRNRRNPPCSSATDSTQPRSHAARIGRVRKVMCTRRHDMQEADEKAAILRGDDEMSFEELLAMEKRANGR